MTASTPEHWRKARTYNYQEKITLGQIRRPCVLTYTTLNLSPLHPVCPGLPPMCPVHSELRPLHPLRPGGPELPGNTCSNSMRPEFPHNAGSHPMPSGLRCELLCVRMGGCFIAAS